MVKEIKTDKIKEDPPSSEDEVPWEEFVAWFKNEERKILARIRAYKKSLKR